MGDKIGKALNGLLCVYKPADLSLNALKKNILKRICTQGNLATGWPRLPEIDVREYCSSSFYRSYFRFLLLKSTLARER